MKTEHGHTPAPWVATGYKNTVVNDANGNTLALYPAHDSTTETAQANAKLIAAAPELLAACELLLGRLDEDEDRNAKWIGDTARAAIAKALGHE